MAAPVFDAVTEGTRITAIATTTGSTFTHTGTGSNLGGILCIVDTNEYAVSGQPAGTPTATYGGASMTYLGSVKLGNVNAAGFIAVYVGTGLTAGAQSVVWSMTQAGQTFGNIYPVMTTFTGVGSFGTLATAFQNSTTRTVSVTSSTGNVVWGLAANRVSGSTWSAQTFTNRKSQTATTPDYTSGELASAASSTAVTATDSSGTEGAAVGVEVQAAGSSPAPTNQFFAMF